MVNKISINLPKVKTIYHIADIHIRLYQRQHEYEHVFRNLYEEIKKDTDKAVMFIAGDLVHSKTHLSPELIKLTANFLKSLSKILPVIVMPGNHDLNLSNTTRLDSLSPIIDALDKDNIFYMKESGIYSLANINFYHSSVTDKQQFQKNELLPTGTNIGCYHAPVQGSKNHQGMVFKSEDFNYGYFSKFDFTMLGDIHLPNQSIGDDTVKYPGSLLQQNHGEAPTAEHGMLKWDVESATSEFIPIKNEYGYVTYRMENDDVIEFPNIVPKRPRIRVFTKDTTLAEQKQFKTELYKKYKVEAISIIPVNVGTTTTSLGKVDISDVNSAKSQQELLKTWLRSNIDDITDKEIKEVIEINRKLNDELPKKDVASGVEWELKSLSFSNMFSYIEDNYIDFEKLNGSVGLFGPNHAGKSTLLEVLLFCLFDKCSRASRGVDILNATRDNFECELCFTYRGKEYFIKRTGKRQKKRSNVKIDAEFYTYEDGEKVDLSGVDRKGTYKAIKDYFGEFDMFTNTLVSLQGNTSGFVYQKQAERKTFLAALLGIEIFEQLHSLMSKKVKDSEALLKKFKKTDFETQLADAEVEIELGEKELKENKEGLEEIKKEIEIVRDTILEETKKLKDVPKETLDKKILLKQKETHNTTQEQGSLEIITLNSDLTVTKAKLLKYNSIQKKAEVIVEKYDSYKMLVDEVKDEERSLDKLSYLVQTLRSKSTKLLELSYDEDCTYCMDNVFVKDAIIAKTQLKDKETSLAHKKAEIATKQKEVDAYGDIKAKHEKYKQLLKEINTLERQEIRTNGDILSAELSITKSENLTLKVEEKLKLYEQVKDYLLINETVTKIIDMNNYQLRRMLTTQTTFERDISSADRSVAVNEERIKNYTASIKEMQKIEDELVVYRYYLKAVHKNGIPNVLIRESIPMIEAKINDILTLVTDFTVKFEGDDNSILASIYYDEDNHWPIELTSGFEKFIISLAVRIALSQVSNLSRSNFMVIDEGWGNFDSENLGNVGKIFEYLENNFKFILVVSHIDALHDTVNSEINIDLNDDGSYINNSKMF